MAKKVSKPTDIHSLLDQLGITVPTGNVSRETNASQVLAIANKYGRTPVATAAQTPKVNTPVGSKTYAPAVAWSSKPDIPSDDSSGVFSTLGDIFKTAIKIVDTPRAYAESALLNLGGAAAEKLLPDAYGKTIGNALTNDSGQRPGWDKFTSDASQHKGFQDYLHDAGLKNTTGSWHNLDNLLGFAGDVVLDPLTYASGGAAHGGEKLLAHALEDGGRKAIGKAVAETVVSKGVEGADQLIVDAARKGAGALTAKGLREAGITAEKAAEIGVPKQVYKFMGMEIPKSGIVAEGVANLKGAAKEALGETGAARLVRKLKVTDAFGERGFIDTIRAAKGNPVAQAGAVKALASINVTKQASYGWLGEMLQSIKKSKLAEILTGSPAEKRAVLDASEGVERTAVNDLFDKLHGDLTEKFGVDLPYRENYVPHVLTKEARALDNAEVRSITQSISDQVGFQNERKLNQTIAQANAEFMDKHGVKLFEDDLNTIVQKYLHQATVAIGHKTQADEFIRLGIAQEIPEFAKTAHMAVDEVKRVEKLKSKAVGKAGKSLDLANATREDAALVATESLKAQKKDVFRQMREIVSGTNKLARDADTAATKVRVAETQLEGLKAQLEIAVKQVKNERGGAGSPAQTAARQRVKSIENAIVEKTTALGNAKQAVSDIMTSTQVNVGAKTTASKGFVAETRRLGEEYKTLVAKHTDLTAELESLKLKNSPPGAGPLTADLHVQEANVKIADMTDKLAHASAQADIAQGAYDMAIADKSAVTTALDKQTTELSDAIKKLGTRKAPKSLEGKAEYAGVLSENLDMARTIINGTDDPAAQLLGRMEATASMHDVAALLHGSEVEKWDHMLGVLKDPKFRTYMEQEVSDGFARLNETYQIPDWADQALQARTIFGDKDWKSFMNFYDKTLNVTKGYMIARPGFVVRNMYSSLSNVYFEAGLGAAESIGTYHKFLKIAEKYPEDFRERALAQWGDSELVDRLTTAMHISAGTGGGQSLDEVGVGFFKGLSANPFSPDFAPIKGIRHLNGEVEKLVRGGHAFDVLQRGGSADLALDTVEKWHFNYRDITDFDRQAKRVMPFWTFFSKNMSLQAQTFTKILPKLNRTYFNAMRNLENGQTPDQLPSYWEGTNPLRIGGSGSDVKYLFPDLPPLQALSDASQIVSSHGSSLLGQTAPIPKFLADMYSDKQSFSQIPFSDKMNQAPLWAQIPGVNLLPGFEQGASGKTVTTDRTQYGVENFLPTLGQASRLGKASGDNINPILSWLGISVRDNTDKMRSSTANKKAKAYAAELARRKELANS